jgi:hypothetical protein
VLLRSLRVSGMQCLDSARLDIAIRESINYERLRCQHLIAFVRDLRGNRHSIRLVFTQPKLETSFEDEDVTNRIVIDNGFNA